MLTCLLTASALLFVINQDIPKLSYLTRADRVIVGTFALLFVVGAESWVSYTVCRWGPCNATTAPDDPWLATALQIDKWTVYAVLALYFLLITKVLGVPLAAHARVISSMGAARQAKLNKLNAGATNKSHWELDVVPCTVEPDPHDPEVCPHCKQRSLL